MICSLLPVSLKCLSSWSRGRTKRSSVTAPSSPVVVLSDLVVASNLRLKELPHDNHGSLTDFSIFEALDDP
jgi:hypothetical protein